MIEFMSKKGQMSSINQDNMFCLVDGETKIFGLFDGHGPNGHLVSGFVMGQMLDFIKNSKIFRDKDLFGFGSSSVSDADMKKAIRMCFQYAQDRVRQQYYDYLVDCRKRKMAERQNLDRRNFKKRKLAVHL